MIVVDSKITTNIKISLNESEARALEALAGYGDAAFLEVFYNKLGKHYLQPHEDGLKSLFKSIRDMLPVELTNVDKARKLLENKQ